MRNMSILVAAALSAAVGVTAMAEEPKEAKISIDAAPAAAQRAINKAVGTGHLVEVVKEALDGKTVFEADFTVDKVEHSVKVTEAGEVIEEESGVEVNALPAAVTDALKAKYAKADVEDASLVKAGDKEFYEIGVKVDGAEREIKMDASGKILEDTAKAHEEDEEDEKDEKGEHHDGDKK